jgi:hypothetical protein
MAVSVPRGRSRGKFASGDAGSAFGLEHGEPLEHVQLAFRSMVAVDL